MPNKLRGGLKSGFSLDTSSFQAGIRAAVLEYNRRSLRAITIGAKLFEAELKKTLSQAGTGRINTGRSKSRTVKGQRVFSASKANRRSAPGQPPAVDTGRLRSSITSIIERELTAWVASVGTNVEYATILEFGGFTGKNKSAFIEARPYMLTTLSRIRPKLLAIFQITLAGR